MCIFHCVKSVRVGSVSGPHFPAFGLNTERKTQTRKTPSTDIFHALCDSYLQQIFLKKNGNVAVLHGGCSNIA